jgi:ABC-2 type transport system permease protein/oleandomycin transport system permease protein
LVIGAQRSEHPMTSVLETQAVVAEEPGGGVVWMLRDWRNEASRHLRAMPRTPDILIFALMQPIMFVLLFKYVFGGSIKIPGYDKYDQYLMPGIFAQTVVFGSSFTAVGLAEDMTKGFIDRLRSLPISQPAVLIGRTISDTLRNLITFTVMLGVAFAIGFRFDGGLVRGVLATLLLLMFSYSFSWISALIGISVKSVEAANSAGFIWMFPLTFVSSAFVDPERMTGWLQPIARNNPFTVLTNACRALYNGYDAGNDPWVALAWAVGITVVFAILTTRKFAKSTSG